MRRSLPPVLLVAALVLGASEAPEGGRTQDQESEAREPVDLNEILNAQRQNAGSLERSPSGVRDLDRRKQNHTRDRIGPINWNLYSDW